MYLIFWKFSNGIKIQKRKALAAQGSGRLAWPSSQFGLAGPAT
jgi:hypothetical protein